MMMWASFHPSAEGSLTDIVIDVWLYGELARYGGSANQGSFANLQLTLEQGSTLTELLTKLTLPTKQRGITFINGDLSALPGIQPDLDHVLADGDRVAFFHLRSMWPYQYRHGAAMVSELSSALNDREDLGMQHTTRQIS